MNVSSVCGDLTRVVRTEVNCKDGVTEAHEVIQLSEVALQRAAGKTGFMERSHETKYKGIQTGWSSIEQRKRIYVYNAENRVDD